jgi:hypothetical protein
MPSEANAMPTTFASTDTSVERIVHGSRSMS